MMVRTAYLPLVAGVLIATAGAASAQDQLPGQSTAPDWSKNFYLRLDTGASFTTDANRNFGNSDFGDGYAIGGGIGYRFDPHWRTDMTLSYRGNYGFATATGVGPSHGDVDALVGLVNGYYDFTSYAGFTPYIGGGIGFSSNHISPTGVAVGPSGGSLNSDTSSQFAWQVGAGVSYNLSQNWALDIGYRYLDMGEARTGDDLAINGVGTIGSVAQHGDLQAHEVQVGLRYSF
jgi:opacity protein-like surface antigen